MDDLLAQIDGDPHAEIDLSAEDSDTATIDDILESGIYRAYECIEPAINMYLADRKITELEFLLIMEHLAMRGVENNVRNRQMVKYLLREELNRLTNKEKQPVSDMSPEALALVNDFVALRGITSDGQDIDQGGILSPSLKKDEEEERTMEMIIEEERKKKEKNRDNNELVSYEPDI